MALWPCLQKSLLFFTNEAQLVQQEDSGIGEERWSWMNLSETWIQQLCWRNLLMSTTEDRSGFTWIAGGKHTTQLCSRTVALLRYTKNWSFPDGYQMFIRSEELLFQIWGFASDTMLWGNFSPPPRAAPLSSAWTSQKESWREESSQPWDLRFTGFSLIRYDVADRWGVHLMQNLSWSTL